MNTISSSTETAANNSFDNPRTASTAQPSFAPKDFLQILAAAIGSGVGVSVVIAGLALALSSSAEAQVLPKNSVVKATLAQSAQATVGGLYIGGGCDREPVEAVERDWLVKIDGNTAEVRVMQTFLMPAEGPTVAFFEAILLPKARLIALKAHTPEKILSGKVISIDDFAGMSRLELNKFGRHDALMMWNEEGKLATNQIMNLIPDETVVIEYTYSINTQSQNGLNELDIALNAAESEALFTTKPNLTSGTVWVEWVGVKPKRLVGSPVNMPVDVTLEESAQGITGLSWFTPSLAPATAMKFAWETDTSFSKTVTANR